MNQLQSYPDPIRTMDNNNNNFNNIQQTNGQSLPSIATMLTQNMPGAPTTLPRNTDHLEIVPRQTDNSPTSAPPPPPPPINQPHNDQTIVTSNTQQSPPGSVPARVYTVNQNFSPQYIDTYPPNMNSQQSSANGNITLQPQVVTSVMSNNNQVYPHQMQPQNIILTQQMDYNNSPTLISRAAPMSPSMIQPQFHPNHQQQYYIVSSSVVPSHNIIQQPMNFNMQTLISQQQQSKPQPMSVVSIENQQQQQQQMEYYAPHAIPTPLVYPVINLQPNSSMQSNIGGNRPTQMSPPQSQLDIRSPGSTNQKVFMNNHVRQNSYSSSNIQLVKQEHQFQLSQPRQRFQSYPQISFNQTANKKKSSLDGQISPTENNRNYNGKLIGNGKESMWLSDSYSESHLNKSRNTNHESATFNDKDSIKLVDANGNVLIRKKLDPRVLKGKQCPICGKKCSRPSILKTHYFIHTGEAPYKCSWPKCGKTFNVKSNMVRHRRAHESTSSQ